MNPPNSKLFSMFLGAKGENVELLTELLNYGINRHGQWRARYAPQEPSLYPENFDVNTDKEELRAALDELLDRLEKNPPYFHPRYSAQMLKDPTIPAVLGYLLTMLINPNNHAYEGGPATTLMELEVIDDLLRLIGFPHGWGHLTSGGSLANLEALWAIRDTYREGKVLFSTASHLSWKKICQILDIGNFEEIPVDSHYRMDLEYLESSLKSGRTMMVMANFGTTGCGAIDPISDLLRLREKYGFHLHVDAAYGGYMKALLYDEDYHLLPPEQTRSVVHPYLREQAIALSRADSITIDPHKHGMMPYGAGSVLYRDERLKRAMLHSAPYTYHVADKPNIGTYTLEGSRPGAAAAGVWLTHRLFPLHQDGLGLVLEQTLKTARACFELFGEDDELVPVVEPDLDIFCFYQTDPDGPAKLSTINQKTLKIYQQLSIENPQAEFILSKLIIDRVTAASIVPNVELDEEYMVAMRAVFIKHWMVMGQGKNYVERLHEAVKSISVKNSSASRHAHS